MVTTKIKASLFTATLAAAVAAGFSAVPVLAEEAEADAKSLEEMLTGGDLNLQFRYRFEYVDQEDNAADVAKASTLKSRIIYQTKKFNDFVALVEVDDISVIGSEMYNDTVNGKTQYSVVADPEGTEVNQAWLAWSGVDNTTLKWGRQRINLDDQRFIGGVGWRQNEQTFDSTSIVNTSLENTKIFYGYLNNVNRVFGPDDGANKADLDSSSHVLNVSYEGWSAGKLSVYGYWLDLDDAPSASSRTYGFRFDGKQKLNGSDKDGTTILYTAEYATQDDYGDNSTSYDADYYLLEGGANFSGVTAKLGYAVLESDEDAGVGFSTPLATGHKFQGWADLFLSTPAGGIEDTYVSLSGKVLGTTVTVVYHDFEADEDSPGAEDFGDEIDIAIAYKWTKNLSVLLKYANYNAKDEFKTGVVDTEKAWVQVLYSL